jgi:diaminopimelate decarboxylase
MFPIENRLDVENVPLTIGGISSPGRYLAADSTMLLTKVNTVKDAAKKFLAAPWIRKFR